jgi:hypothetical protein
MADESKLILDTFNEKTGPAEVDWNARSDTSVAWAALAGDSAAITEVKKRGLGTGTETTAAEGTEVFYDPHQPRGKDGRWRKGIGIPAPNIAPISSEPVVNDAEEKLLSGGYAEIDPGHLDELLRDMVNHRSVNLERLRVTGKDNRGIYREHAREIPRKEMPQLPEDVEGARRLQEALGDTKTELLEIDPRELRLTQNELDSVKVGKLYGYIKDGGYDPNSLLYASREGCVVDGHHRFAGACAAAATGSSIKVKVLKVDMPIDDLLKVADRVSGEKVGMGAGFTGRGRHFQDEDRPPPPSENEPWVWLDGKWYKIVTDTDDGVPSNLDYLHDNEEPTTASTIDPAAITRRVFISRWHS